jgi:hypothetical protein
MPERVRIRTICGLVEVLSPELVLVAPPDLARLAREQLPLPWEVLPLPSFVAAERAPRPSRRSALAFGAFCLLNSLAPLALLIAAHR